MKPVNVTTLFALPIDEIKELKHSISILYSDGVVIPGVHYKDIILFRYLMDLYIKLPRFTLSSDLHIRNFFKNNYVNKDTHTSLYSKVFEKYVNEYVKPTKDTDSIVDLFKEMYRCIDVINRDIWSVISDYVIDIEIEDILPIQFHKDMLESIKYVTINPSKENIDRTYSTINTIIQSPYCDNLIMRLVYNSQMVNINQLNQLFGSRGKLTELDNRVFTKPMANSFTLGAKNIYELAIESRAAAKSLYVSHTKISYSEYLARELQLVSMVVEGIHFGDCGSQDYYEFYVRPKEIVNGKVVYKGDLKNIIGKYYLNEDTGKLEIVKENSHHLIGKTLKLRSSFKCNHPDKKKICSTCFGELAYSIFETQNLGHITITNLTKQITQIMLSIKHLMKSADVSSIPLTNQAREFFIVRDGNKLQFHQKHFNAKTKRVKLVIEQQYAPGLKDVYHGTDILNINITKASRLKELTINFVGKDKTDQHHINLTSTSRYGYFSLNFINYVAKYGYNIDEMHNYSIDITDWDPKKPIIEYEKVEFDYGSVVSEFRSIVRKRKYFVNKTTGSVRSEFTADVLCSKLYDVSNKKLDINIALIEVLVYALTAQDLSTGNYDLGRNSPNNDVLSLKDAIDRRSIGANFAWNQLQNKPTQPTVFNRTNKPTHPLDVLYDPANVIKNDTD